MNIAEYSNDELNLKIVAVYNQYEKKRNFAGDETVKRAFMICLRYSVFFVSTKFSMPIAW